jgi:glycosyltransferase involved in cell wall biosynthesis
MWFCSQLGAREHYAIPRALHRSGALGRLITESWLPPSSVLRAIVRSQKSAISNRFHNELSDARVTAFTFSSIAFELLSRARGLRGWEKVIARNRWFQRKATSALADLRPTISDSPILFSYSYTALEPLRFAKSRGWRTVLGQIDPGPFEEEIVAAEAEREPSLAPDWTPAPADYWKSWRAECELADRIIVNSQWSFDALVGTGIPKEKLSIIPLAFENKMPSVLPKKYPRQFTATRPLRVLFLGQINLRKGIARLLKAAPSFQSQPVEFLMVGPVQIHIPEDLRSNRKLRWFGPVARNKVRNYYEQADVLILPTLSDGFALSQLEAIAHRLPVIASRRCGEMVIDRVNGLLLEEPTGAAIEEALRSCLHNPDQLAQFSQNATLSERFSLSCLGTQLCTVAW